MVGFPIDLSSYIPIQLDPSRIKLSKEEKEQLSNNIRLARDAIIFFTAFAGAKGLSGHSGGAYDVVPEAMILEGLINGSDKVYPVIFDEAGHRVALQYLLAVFRGHLHVDRLMHYREFSEENPLPGHPEVGVTYGVGFSSGRLGHMWPFLNGVAKAHPEKAVFVLGSDGSQQEGNDAEAARFAVANKLNVNILVDDNNVTIAGHPSEYLKGYSVAKTLKGHGLSVNEGDPEDIDALYNRIRNAINKIGPVALVNKRKMATGIKGIEGECKAHETISVELAIKHLKKRWPAASEILKSAQKQVFDYQYIGSSPETKKNRSEFGNVVADIIEKIPENERNDRIFVVDCDLAGSTGLNNIQKRFPELYINGGIMERGNYSAAAGFGFKQGRQGIFATFSAFSEMVISEIQMARLNEANVLAHFSHAGVDGIADNTCHFGMNIFFTDNGLTKNDHTRLYFPADAHQMKSCLEQIFWDQGTRFVFSNRSAVPYILDEEGGHFFENRVFEPGKDDLIREGEGFIVSYGSMLYRCLDAVERLKQEGVNIGLINKATLNIIDEDVMNRLKDAKYILVVEDQNAKTGLGSKFGTWLLMRGFKGTYDHIGTWRHGHGGVHEQVMYQGLESWSIQDKVRHMI